MDTYAPGKTPKNQDVRDTLQGVMTDASHALAFGPEPTNDELRDIRLAIRRGWTNESKPVSCFQARTKRTSQDQPEIDSPSVVMPDEVIGWANMVLLRQNQALPDDTGYGDVGRRVIEVFKDDGWSASGARADSHNLASLPTLMAHAFGAGLDKVGEPQRSIVAKEAGRVVNSDSLPDVGRRFGVGSRVKDATSICVVHLNWWMFTTLTPVTYTKRLKYEKAADALLGVLP